MDRIATASYEPADAPPSSPVVFATTFIDGTPMRRLASGLWQKLHEGLWMPTAGRYSAQEECIDALMARLAELQRATALRSA